MTNDGKGYVLNGGQIWTQGNHMMPCGNSWGATGTFTWSLPSNPQTFTKAGANPNNSKLWVRTGVGTDPTKNGNDALACTKTYGCLGGITTGSGNGLNTTPMSLYFSCSPDIIHAPVMPLHKMAQKQDTFETNTGNHHWMSQFSLWENLCKDDSLVDSTGILDMFKAFAQNSRYKHLTDIENQLAYGHIDSAQSLLNQPTDSMANTQTDSTTGVQMADDVTANDVVGGYQQFYQLYLNYLNNNLSAADSLSIEALAGACPFTYGSAVYKARALYDLVYNDLRIFTYTCDTPVADTSGGGERKGRSTGNSIVSDDQGQEYTLFPNPNKGKFILQQSINDNKPVNLELINSFGQSIYKTDASFLNQKTNIDLSPMPTGVYLLKLIDNGGRKFIFKFSVQ